MKTALTRYILVALLVLFHCTDASAQKHVLYADVGVSLSRFSPGLSATYNYKFARFMGIGIGVQGYPFYPTMTSPHQFVPAIFGDLRFTIRPRKMGQLFAFLDIGIDFYKHSDNYSRDGNIAYTVDKDNGTYTGLGCGYFRRLTKRGGGPYGSLKIISNGYKANAYNVVSHEQRTESWSRGSAAVSVGFRF